MNTAPVSNCIVAKSRRISPFLVVQREMSRPAEAVRRRLCAVRRACARIKTGRSASRRPEATAFPVGAGLEVGGATVEWCCVCLSTVLPCAALTVAGVTSAYVTGPSAVLSTLIAAAAASLAGTVIHRRQSLTITKIRCRHALRWPNALLFSRIGVILGR